MRLERLALEDLTRLGGPIGVAAHMRALVPRADSVGESVSEIIASVRDGGDQAVLELTRQLDTLGAQPRALRLAAQELDEAITRMGLDVVAGLQVAIANVALVADAGVDHPVTVELPQGHTVTLREVPVARAGIYVPGGRAAYPSTVVMGVVTARAAGVLDVSVCSPPGPDGEIALATLAACRLCGVERVYRMGGAQAIAALAYGTETVARVDVIVGPGNLYVQEAKRQLSGVVGIDGFAGPSDLLVVVGPDAPHEPVALDMLAQAEHGMGSFVGVISSSPATLDRLAGELQRLCEQRPDIVPSACVLVEVSDATEAIRLANEFAPEHLQLVGEGEERLSGSVSSAGCLFVGVNSATAFGDYVAGSNHVLPTAGAARFSSGLSVRHFRRRMPEVRIGRQAAARLAAAGAPIALVEGFAAHAASMRARIGDNHDQ